MTLHCSLTDAHKQKSDRHHGGLESGIPGFLLDQDRTGFTSIPIYLVLSSLHPSRFDRFGSLERGLRPLTPSLWSSSTPLRQSSGCILHQNHKASACSLSRSHPRRALYHWVCFCGRFAAFRCFFGTRQRRGKQWGVAQCEVENKCSCYLFANDSPFYAALQLKSSCSRRDDAGPFWLLSRELCSGKALACDLCGTK